MDWCRISENFLQYHTDEVTGHGIADRLTRSTQQYRDCQSNCESIARQVKEYQLAMNVQRALTQTRDALCHHHENIPCDGLRKAVDLWDSEITKYRKVIILSGQRRKYRQLSTDYRALLTQFCPVEAQSYTTPPKFLQFW